MAVQIVTVHNVRVIEYTALVDLLHDIYCKDVPEIGLGKPLIATELVMLAGFFANQYAYMIELWGVMSHEVRLMKRISKDNKENIDSAMDKRDYLDKVASACKLKYYACSALMRAATEDRT